MQKCKKALDNSQKCEYSVIKEAKKMSVKMNELENEMKSQHITDDEMAKALGIDKSTWNRRKDNPKKFKIGEVQKIKDMLNLPNYKATYIFLD